MKFLWFIPLTFFLTYTAFSNSYRILDGSTVFGEPVAPHPAAIFQVESTTQGWLPPRMTEAQRDALVGIYGSLPVGLMIFNTDEGTAEAWAGANWTVIAGGPSPGTLLTWGASNLYRVDDFIWQPDTNQLYVCIEEHTSSADFNDDLSKWQKLIFLNEDDFVVIGELTVEGASVFEGSFIIDTTAAAVLPVGTTAQRPDPAASGMIRFNTDLTTFEGYNGTEWGSIGGGLSLWEASKPYKVDDIILLGSTGTIYKANTDHTSSADFATDIANWDEVSNPFLNTNLNISGNSLISTDTDGNIVLDPNGTGVVDIQSDAITLGITTTGVIDVTGSVDVDNLRLDGNTISSTDTDGDIILSPNGTGAVNLPGITVSQPAYINADGDLVSQDIDLTTDVTGILPVANGGTGSSTQNFVDLTTNQSIAGEKSFTDTVSISETTTNEALTVTHDGSVDAVSITQTGAGDALAVTGDSTLTGTLTVTGDAQIDNVEINGNSIVATDTDGDLSLSPDGDGDLTTTLDTNSYSLDPQINHGNLIPNASFERADLSDVVCTDATVARIASPLLGENNKFALEITATDDDWTCTITGDASQGQGNLVFKANTDGNATACSMVDGSEQTCDSIRELSVMQSYAIPTVLGSTSNGIRVRGTTSGDKVQLDLVEMKAGQVISQVTYQNEAIINLAGSGNFTGGSIKVSRVGNNVTITTPIEITHASLTAPTSASGVIPSWARPQTQVYNAYLANSASGDLRNIIARPDGTVVLVYDASRTGTGGLPTITYTVAASQSSAAFISECVGLECENEFKASISSTGVVSEPAGLDWIDGSASITSTSVYTIDFQAGLFAGAPICEATIAQDNAATVRINSVSATQVVVQTTDGGFLNAARAFNLECGRSTDYVQRKAIVGYFRKDLVSGGAEVLTEEYWDGEPIYRRCYEIASDITTTTDIETGLTGLNPVDAIKFDSNLWSIKSRVGSGSSSSIAGFEYNSSTGVLFARVVDFIVGAGSRFCFRYTY